MTPALEALGRALCMSDGSTWEECIASTSDLYGAATDPLDVADEWYQTPRIFAAAILAALSANGFTIAPVAEAEAGRAIETLPNGESDALTAAEADADALARMLNEACWAIDHTCTQCGDTQPSHTPRCPTFTALAAHDARRQS